MNRRDFLAGSMTLAGGQKLLGSMGAMAAGDRSSQPLVAPHDLLSTTYTESFLRSKLISADEWHPFPTASERGPWEAIPADIRAAFVEKAHDYHTAGWEPLLASVFLNFKRNGNQAIYQAKFFARRTQLQCLVLAECMEGKGRFLDDITNGIWLICEETCWSNSNHLYMQHVGIGLPDVTDPIIDLYAAATSQVLAWTRYLLGEQLNQVSPLIEKRIVIEVERRVLKPARERDDFWWMGLNGSGRKLNNWNPWINSNLTTTNLLIESDPQLRLHELVRITRSVDQYLNQYWPDGGEEEGPGYFNVSPLCLFECLDFIESATGHATNIFANPFLDAMGRYIMNAHIAGNDYINYGDAHVNASPEGTVIYRFGKAVHDEQLQAFGAWCAASHGWTATGEGLAKVLNNPVNAFTLNRSMTAVLDANEIRGAAKQDALLRDSYYPVMGLMTAREKANSAEGMYVAVLACNNNRSHGHNDTGSYIIFQDGEPLAIDVGVEAYNSKTFSADRYKIWTMQSAYHNLPTIGGAMQHNGAEYKATDRKYASNDERATYSFNIAATYPKEAGVKSWVRTVTLDRVQDKITVEEDFELERAVPISLTVMTQRIAAVKPGGSITLKLASGEGAPSLLKFDGAQFEPKVETITLADAGLRGSWGKQIYRILLNTKQPVVRDKWSYEFTRA